MCNCSVIAMQLRDAVQGLRDGKVPEVQQGGLRSRGEDGGRTQVAQGLLQVL
jgi:hypothetical protein